MAWQWQMELLHTRVHICGGPFSPYQTSLASDSFATRCMSCCKLKRLLATFKCRPFLMLYNTADHKT